MLPLDFVENSAIAQEYRKPFTPFTPRAWTPLDGCGAAREGMAPRGLPAGGV